MKHLLIEFPFDLDLEWIQHTESNAQYIIGRFDIIAASVHPLFPPQNFNSTRKRKLGLSTVNHNTQTWLLLHLLKLLAPEIKI